MTFDQIVGQSGAVSRLKSYMDAKSLDGAYLFTGPEGVGKALTALVFAKAVNCQTDGAFGCESCVSCTKIDKAQHPDIHVIDSSANGSGADMKDDDQAFLSSQDDSRDIKIAQIRALQADINYRPYEARKKVFIINNAHNLNSDSANAFLKTLEEPPADSMIILVSDRPSLLLPTIRSRCRVVKFYPMDRTVLRDYLLGAGGRQGVSDRAEAHFLAFFSEGSLGVSLRLKAEGMFEKKNRIIAALCSLNSSVESAAKISTRQELMTAFNVLASWFRDIYMVKTGVGADELVNSDRRLELEKLAGTYSFEDLDRIFSVLSEAVLHVERNLNRKLLLSNVIVSCKPARGAFA